MDQTTSDLFKAYDIRGVVPAELTPEIAYRIGRALVTYLGVDHVCVGRDMRVSGPMLAAASVSYTHLTPPTSELGVILGVAVFFKK